MVISAILATTTAHWMLAAAGIPAGQDEIPPDARATALMAYLGLVLLAIFLIASVVIATRWIRRQVGDREDRAG